METPPTPHPASSGIPPSGPADAEPTPGPGLESGLRNLRLLLIEDDPIYRRALRDFAGAKGATVLEADTAAAGMKSALKDSPDFVMADLRLPDGRGDELCRELRRRGFAKPVVILTAHGDPATQIGGFESGADEFWTKPIPLRLVELRILAILRRTAPPDASQPRELVINGMTFDFARRRATRGDEILPFSSREIGVLEALWLARGAPVSRADLLARVWNYDRVPNTRTVDNLVVSLRRKLGSDPSGGSLIATVNGIGYQLVLD